MSISSSFNAGLAGLQSNAARLATISDNISNSSTFGYKRVETDFQSIVANGGSAGGYSAGGVTTSSNRIIDQTMPLKGTSNPTDLAIDGRGMLPVTTGAAVDSAGGQMPMLMQTTGSFRADENGILRSASDMVLLGWPAGPDGSVPASPRDTMGALEPVRVTANQFTGNPTSRIDLGLNLPATSTEAGAAGNAETLSLEYFGNMGRPASLDVAFSPTVPGAGASNEWTMTVTDPANAGATVGEYTLTFDDSAANGGMLAAVTQTGGAPGGVYDPASGTVSVDLGGQTIDLAIGTPGEPDGITQLSDSFAPVAIDKDGSAVGNLVSVEVDEQGMVNAVYDNGATRTIYQVPVADVPNPNGLIALDNQAYRASEESGGFYLWDAGDGPTGNVAGYSREESATDVAAELTQMIQTQRAYSSSAKVIQTVDEMLQETTNIKR